MTKISWIGVDLDGTLAKDNYSYSEEEIGEPVPKMMERVKAWIAEGTTIKIFTARANSPSAIPFIEKWLIKHGIGGLEITCKKDYGMIELWDDRAIQVIPNTGERIKNE